MFQESNQDIYIDPAASVAFRQRVFNEIPDGMEAIINEFINSYDALAARNVQSLRNRGVSLPSDVIKFWHPVNGCVLNPSDFGSEEGITMMSLARYLTQVNQVSYSGYASHRSFASESGGTATVTFNAADVLAGLTSTYIPALIVDVAAPESAHVGGQTHTVSITSDDAQGLNFTRTASMQMTGPTARFYVIGFTLVDGRPKPAVLRTGDADVTVDDLIVAVTNLPTGSKMTVTVPGIEHKWTTSVFSDLAEAFSA